MLLKQNGGNHRPRVCFFLLLLSVLPSYHLVSSALLSSSEECSQNSTLYACPNCGGTLVTDCTEYCDGFLSTDTTHKICFDRTLFNNKNTDPDDHGDYYDYLWNDLVGAFVWFFMAGIATACGVGGGGIYVPLGILLFLFAPKQASGLSQASIFGASLGGMFLNVRDVHPENRIRDDPGRDETKEDDDGKCVETGRALQVPLSSLEEHEYGGEYYTRPLVNYDMALFLAPMEMAGAVLGVLVQKILPNWLYLLLAGLVLSATSHKTYKKFFQTRAKEATAREKAAKKSSNHNNKDSIHEKAVSEEGEASNLSTESDEDGGGGNLSPPRVILKPLSVPEVEMEIAENNNNNNSNNQEQADDKDGNEGTQEEQDDNDEAREIRRRLLRDDMRQYPKEKLFSLLVLWVGLLVLTLLKGGKGLDSLVGIDCTSPWYVVLIACQFLWMFGFAIVYGIKLLRKQTERVSVQYPFFSEDPVWDQSSLRFYGVFTFVAGIVAGLIGIGGGMVLGPLMLIMGIHPRVSTATTATMIVLTSSSVAVIYVTSGLVPWSYAVFYFAVCLNGAYVGKSRIDGYVKRTGRASLLVFILATIILFATIGCLVIMLINLREQNWCFEGLRPFCSISSQDETCSVNRMLFSSNTGGY